MINRATSPADPSTKASVTTTAYETSVETSSTAETENEFARTLEKSARAFEEILLPAVEGQLSRVYHEYYLPMIEGPFCVSLLDNFVILPELEERESTDCTKERHGNSNLDKNCRDFQKQETGGNVKGSADDDKNSEDSSHESQTQAAEEKVDKDKENPAKTSQTAEEASSPTSSLSKETSPIENAPSYGSTTMSSLTSPFNINPEIRQCPPGILRNSNARPISNKCSKSNEQKNLEGKSGLDSENSRTKGESKTKQGHSVVRGHSVVGKGIIKSPGAHSNTRPKSHVNPPKHNLATASLSHGKGNKKCLAKVSPKTKPCKPAGPSVDPKSKLHRPNPKMKGQPTTDCPRHNSPTAKRSRPIQNLTTEDSEKNAGTHRRRRSVSPKKVKKNLPNVSPIRGRPVCGRGKNVTNPSAAENIKNLSSSCKKEKLRPSLKSKKSINTPSDKSSKGSMPSSTLATRSTKQYAIRSSISKVKKRTKDGTERKVLKRSLSAENGKSRLLSPVMEMPDHPLTDSEEMLDSSPPIKEISTPQSPEKTKHVSKTTKLINTETKILAEDDSRETSEASEKSVEVEITSSKSKGVIASSRSKTSFKPQKIPMYKVARSDLQGLHRKNRELS